MIDKLRFRLHRHRHTHCTVPGHTKLLGKELDKKEQNTNNCTWKSVTEGDSSISIESVIVGSKHNRKKTTKQVSQTPARQKANEKTKQRERY